MARRKRTDFIAIHCSATRPSMDIGAATIRRWHTGKGWKDIGYAWVIRRNGKVERGRNEDVAGSHVRGYNSRSVGICMVGGVKEDGKTPENNFTRAQWASLEREVKRMKAKWPAAKVQGHRDFPKVAKACPCFDAIDWWAKVSRGDCKVTEEPHSPPVNPDEVILSQNTATDWYTAKLQEELNAKGYPAGAVDGDWGQLTDEAVLKLKLAEGLDTSNTEITLKQVRSAKARVVESRQVATVKTLRERKSETVSNNDAVKNGGLALGSVGLVSGAAKMADDVDVAAGAVEKIKSATEPAHWLLDTVSSMWPLALIGGGVWFVWSGHAGNLIRLARHKEAKHL